MVKQESACRDKQLTEPKAECTDNQSLLFKKPYEEGKWSSRRFYLLQFRYSLQVTQIQRVKKKKIYAVYTVTSWNVEMEEI